MDTQEPIARQRRDAGKFHKAVRLIEEIAANKKLTEEHRQ